MALPSGYLFPDVSRYRTVCNWDAFDDYPVAACKATEGASGMDPSWVAWRAEMRRRNRFPVGYHFLRQESSIASQVTNYLRAIDDGKPFGVMLDVENSGVGTKPSVAQANEWLNRVSGATGIPRKNMLVYMPRWWWRAYGGGSTALSDTICHNSHFGTSPYLGAYAGWSAVDVIQFSSTAPIKGVCPPGTGDMNIAINMSWQKLIASLSGGAVTPPEPPEEEDVQYLVTYAAPNKPPRVYVDGALVGFPKQEEMTEYVKAFTNAGYVRKTVTFAEADDWQRHMDGHFSQVSQLKADLQADITEIKAAVVGVSTGVVDPVELAEALKNAGVFNISPEALEAIRKIVDGELDKRNVSLGTTD